MNKTKIFCFGFGQVAEGFINKLIEEKKVVIIKNGDHSLSNKLSIKKILKELDRFRNTIL